MSSDSEALYDPDSESHDEQNADDTPLLQLYTFFLSNPLSAVRHSFKCSYDFFSMFLQTITNAYRFPGIPNTFLERLPSNLHQARKAIGSTRISFQRYVCCPACRSIYNWHCYTSLW